MPPRKSAASFGAFIEPAGIYLVEYRRERDGIAIIRHHEDARRVIGLADAGERVSAIIKNSSLPSSRLAAAVRGFGSTYQIMMLPPAEPAVLGAVVKREMTRLNPDMDNPRVDYVLGGEVDRRVRKRPEGGTPQQEVLVGAAPEIALSAFGEELALAGVELDHLTLLPQVIQRLYERADRSRIPTACFVDLPGGPLIGFFNEGQLRLVVEPPIAEDEDLESRVQTLAEHLDRGNLYLRQQFRGVELGRLLIAVNPAAEPALLEALRARLAYPVDKFPGSESQPSALVALGAVLDAEAERGLNLSPYAISPLVKAERRKRRSVTLGAGIVAALAIVWAAISVVQVLNLSRKIEADRRLAESRMSTLAPLRVVAANRQKNAQSVAYLQKLRTDEEHVQQLFRALVRATPPGVQLSSFSISRSGEEWSASVAGSAFGDTGADVLLGVDRLYHAIPREMSVHDLLLTELADAPGEGFGAAMKFTMTFVASGQPRTP